ncbi:MAG: hypothetical protein AAF787_08825 [Chloroflexota bacterium]
MAKKSSRKKPTKNPGKPQPQVNPFGWLKREMVGLPRYVRLVLVFMMSIGVTLATFPLLTWFFRLIATLTNNPELVLQYTFADERGVLNVLLGFSLVVGAVYYFIGWRIYIGIVGETPRAHGRVIWYFVVGIVLTLLGAGWVVAGVFSGTAPPV